MVYSLSCYLLEVDELGLVGVEQEAAAVVAHRVAADAGLRVFKLLLYVLDGALAVEAQEGAAHQLGVHWVCANDLPADAHQRADAQSSQLADPGGTHHKDNETSFKKRRLVKLALKTSVLFDLYLCLVGRS